MTPEDIKQTVDRHEKDLERMGKEMEQLKKQPVFDERERPKLKKLFYGNLIYLGVLIVASVSISIYFLANPPDPRAYLAMAGGMLGSAIAATMSCLDRNANGLEGSNGGQTPVTKERKERFNAGMSYWFLFRPWLGAVVGLAAYWGLTAKVFGDKGDMDADLPRLTFYSFVAGFLAKSLLEIFSGMLKNIFKK